MKEILKIYGLGLLGVAALLEPLGFAYLIGIPFSNGWISCYFCSFIIQIFVIGMLMIPYIIGLIIKVQLND